MDPKTLSKVTLSEALRKWGDYSRKTSWKSHLENWPVVYFTDESLAFLTFIYIHLVGL